MKRSILVILALGLIGCGSSTVEVAWDEDVTADAVDIQFGDKDLNTAEGGDKDELEPDVVKPDIHYAENAVLEFLEPYGDDNTKCQGYAGDAKIDRCYFELGYNQIRAFQVLYFEDDTPTSSQEIQWELFDAEDVDTGEPIAIIDTLSSGTNGDGIGTVNVSTFELMGDFVLKASAPNNLYPNIQPLFFDIRIVPKAVEPLTIKLKHEGSAIFDVINVYLWDRATHPYMCSEIDPSDPPFPADKSNTVNSITQTVKFNSFANLSAEHPLTFTACAIGSKINGPPLAFGCDDENVIVEYGKSRTVTIVLRDVPPSYVGTYRVVNHFDMLSALPDDVEQVVNIIIDFFNNPAAGLMELTCTLGGSSLSSLCENFFNDPDNPSIDDLTAVGSIASTIINSILYALLEDNVGHDILFTGKDVGNILRDLEIWSDVQILQEPDDTGRIYPEWTREEWHTVSFQWTLGESCDPTDPNCGLKSYSFNAIGQDVVEAQFEAQVAGYVLGDFDDLIIYPHSLNFKYGAFLNFVIEKLVLPQVAGEGVDSYEKFFGTLVGGGTECLGPNTCCTIFAEEIAGQSGLSWLTMTLESGCNALIPLAANWLRSFLMDLDVNTGSAFTIGTPDNLPCTLYINESDRLVRYMGKEEPPELRCHWDVSLNLGGLPILFDAEWWGQRLQ